MNDLDGPFATETALAQLRKMSAATVDRAPRHPWCDRG